MISHIADVETCQPQFFDVFRKEKPHERENLENKKDNVDESSEFIIATRQRIGVEESSVLAASAS